MKSFTEISPISKTNIHITNTLFQQRSKVNISIIINNENRAY